MSQSSTRNNFSDILLDPTTIALVGSIAVHAILGANLALLTPSVKQIKKPQPGTVKVVELTASELQRIPQAPQQPTVPNPPQTIPPIYQPSTPVPPLFDPAPSGIVTAAPETVPLPPQLGTKPPQAAVSKPPQAAVSKAPQKPPVIVTSPKPKVATKPSAGKKDQKAIPQSQPAPPTRFDYNISSKPTPAPTPTPTNPAAIKKPSPAPTQPAKTTSSANKPSSATSGANDGGENDDTSTPTKVGQNPSPKPTSPSPQASPSPQPTTTPSNDENVSVTGSGFYGKYTVKANNQLLEYEKQYPGILQRSGPPKGLSISYPDGTICPKGEQKPFIVYMIVFDKFTPQDPALGGESSNEIQGTQAVFADKNTPENEKLGKIALAKALEAANTANDNREEKNKNKELLYAYRVQFDPKTCKK